MPIRRQTERRPYQQSSRDFDSSSDEDEEVVDGQPSHHPAHRRSSAQAALRSSPHQNGHAPPAQQQARRSSGSPKVPATNNSKPLPPPDVTTSAQPPASRRPPTGPAGSSASPVPKQLQSSPTIPEQVYENSPALAAAGTASESRIGNLPAGGGSVADYANHAGKFKADYLAELSDLYGGLATYTADFVCGLVFILNPTFIYFLFFL